jgi:hypothetical protein
MPAGELTGKVAGTGKAPVKGDKGAPAAPAQHTPAVQAYAAAKGRPAAGGGAFAAACGAIAAACGTATAGLNAVTAGANAASKLGGEGLGIVRDTVKAADNERGRWHVRWMTRSNPSE